MRKIVVAIVSAVAFTSIMTGTASAAGTAGPYDTLKACEKDRAKYSAKYKTKPCTYLFPVGYFFQYS
jgi:hypothetical protein